MKRYVENNEYIDSKIGGYVRCDGILIEGVYHIMINSTLDEIALKNKDGLVIGFIYNLKSRKECVFGERIEGTDAYDEKWIISDGLRVCNRRD